jgi:hypothetical protein
MVLLESRDAGVPTFAAQGEVSLGELFEAYTAILRSTLRPLTLLDLSSATLAPIDFRGVRDLVERVARLPNGDQERRRSAIVCRREVDFSLARLLMSLLALEGHAMSFAVFPGRSSALAWLSGESRLDGGVIGACGEGVHPGWQRGQV